MMFSLAQTGARKLAHRNVLVMRGFNGTSFLQQNSNNNRAHNEGKKRRGRKNSRRKSKESSSTTEKNFAQGIDEGSIHLRLASEWTTTSTRPTLHPAVQSVWNKLQQQN
jgi:hypothetical protein